MVFVHALELGMMICSCLCICVFRIKLHHFLPHWLTQPCQRLKMLEKGATGRNRELDCGWNVEWVDDPSKVGNRMEEEDDDSLRGYLAPGKNGPIAPACWRLASLGDATL